MRVNRGLLGWGVFFVVVGAVPLVVRYGGVAAGSFDRAWQLWPLLLIGAGLAVLLARARAAVVGGLVVAITAGLILGGLVVNGTGGFDLGRFGRGGFPSCAGAEAGTPFADQRGTLGPGATVSIELDCGGMDISAVDGSRWSVSGSSPDGRPPAVDATSDRLSISSPPRSARVGLGGTTPGGWTIELPRDARSDVEASVNAGEASAALD